MRRALTLAVMTPLAVAPAAAAQAPAPEVVDPGLEVEATASGWTSRSAWRSSTETTCSCSRRPAARSSVIVDGQVRRGRARSRGQLRVRAWSPGHCPASEVPPQRMGLSVLEPEPVRRRQRSPRRRPADGQPHRPLRVEYGRLEFDRNIIKFRASSVTTPTVIRSPARWCCGATTTAGSFASGLTASCTRSSGTPVAAVTRRTCSMARSGPAWTTTNSAARRPTMRTARV